MSTSSSRGKSDKKEQENHGFSINKEFLAGFVAFVAICAAMFSTYDSLYGSISAPTQALTEVVRDSESQSSISTSDINEDLGELKRYALFGDIKIQDLANNGDILAKCEGDRRQFYSEYNSGGGFAESTLLRLNQSFESGCVTAGLDLGHYYLGTFGADKRDMSDVPLGCRYLKQIINKNNEAKVVYNNRCK